MFAIVSVRYMSHVAANDIGLGLVMNDMFVQSELNSYRIHKQGTFNVMFLFLKIFIM